ncbi:MAG: dTMP kinase [Pseudomonadota bacterium]
MSARARPRGRFIVLEGIDGAGTTTQARRLVRALRRRGHEAIVTREPSNGVVGRHIRRCLRQTPGPSAERLASLFAADRLDHVETEILPALARGAMVVSDRYVLSSLAYQGVEGDAAWIETLNNKAPPPDLTLLLDVSSTEAARRRQRRGGIKDRYEVTPFQRRVAARYRELAQVRQVDNVVVLDGSAPVAAIARAILAEVEAMLPARRRL